MAREVKLAHIGLGPIGLAIARLADDTPGLKTAAACDPAPDKAGEDLGLLMGLGKRKRIKVAGDVPRFLRRKKMADVAVLSTTSTIRDAKPQIMALLRKGMHVITTCEELAFPTPKHHSTLREVAQLAVRKKCGVLATGVNPGYAMDALALMLTAPCHRVDRIAVTRVVDAGTRRLPLQRKIGAGLTANQFHRAVTDGAVKHFGLTESAHMIASALGWHLERVDETIDPAIAPRDLDTDYLRIPAGAAAGLRQHLRAYSESDLVISLDLQMYVGAEHPRDHVVVTGEPPIDAEIKGGIAGDEATAAMVINCIPKLLAAPPGILSMHDLTLPHAFNPHELPGRR